MKLRHARFFLIFLMISFSLIIPATGSPGTENLQSCEEENILFQLHDKYGKQLILGDPLEVDSYRIIPVTRIKIANTDPEEGSSPMNNITRGTIQPMGIVVISPEGFEFIRIHESIAGQILERLPVLVRLLNSFIFRDRTGVSHSRISMGELITSVLLLTPEKVLDLGIAAWWVQKLIFACAWYLLAFLTACLIFPFIRSFVHALEQKPFRSIIYGISGTLILVFFSAVMTLTLIGIPLSFILIAFYLLASFTGRVALGVLLGGLVTGGIRSGRTPSPCWVLSGGALMAGARMVPVVGWIIWLFSGIWGFGGVIISLLESRGRNDSIE